MRNGMTMLTLACALVLGACKDKAKACYDDGDNEACQALCETGKPENDRACFEARARALASCVDGKADCATACQSWKDAKISTEQVRNYYVAKLGTEARVATANKMCAGK